MILSVKNVDYLGDYTLLCTFNDGVKKKVDFLFNGADIAPEYLYDHGEMA